MNSKLTVHFWVEGKQANISVVKRGQKAVYLSNVR